VLNTNARRPTKGCKYVDFGLGFFIKKKKKTVFWCWSPRSDDVGQKSLNLTCYDVTHKKKQIQTSQFFIRNYTTLRIFRGFEQLSSYICRQVMTGQRHTNSSGFAMLKGYTSSALCKNNTAQSIPLFHTRI